MDFAFVEVDAKGIQIVPIEGTLCHTYIHNDHVNFYD